ncbi:MAG TPA: MerR family transcriptional regulator [Candidatus Acidoferrales bacterium]|nr:MerR family transcriptional regulator [Candidatus Acidoferrales bacterium]
MSTTFGMSPTAGPAQQQLLRVGDLARATGKTVRAIHLYEELGLLRPATRSSGGFRLYESAAIERVRWIDSLHALGFSLQEMRAVLQSWWGSREGPAAMAGLRELFTRKLAETRDALQRHQQLERELEAGLKYLEACDCCSAPGPVGACASCSQDHHGAEAPALVAGVSSAPENDARGRRSPIVRVLEPRTENAARRGRRGPDERSCET